MASVETCCVWLILFVSMFSIQHMQKTNYFYYDYTSWLVSPPEHQHAAAAVRYFINKTAVLRID
jgi:hypothetical protein